MLLCYLVDLPSCEEKICRLFFQQEYPICIIKTQGIFELISKKIHSAGQNSSNLTSPNIIQSKVLAQVTGRKKILSLDDKAGSKYMCLKVLVPPPAFHHSSICTDWPWLAKHSSLAVCRQRCSSVFVTSCCSCVLSLGECFPSSCP